MPSGIAQFERDLLSERVKSRLANAANGQNQINSHRKSSKPLPMGAPIVGLLEILEYQRTPSAQLSYALLLSL